MMRARLQRFRREERAAVVAEFVLAFPIFFSFFLYSLEMGYMMVRSTMFDRSLDMVVRDLRLGSFGTTNVNAVFLEERVCSRTTFFPECEESIVLELTRVDPVTWALPAPQAPCVRRSATVRAGRTAETYNVGTENQLMVIRACMVVNTVTPLDGEFDYRLWASTAFVNEPN